MWFIYFGIYFSKVSWDNKWFGYSLAFKLYNEFCTCMSGWMAVWVIVALSFKINSLTNLLLDFYLIWTIVSYKRSVHLNVNNLPLGNEKILLFVSNISNSKEIFARIIWIEDQTFEKSGMNFRVPREKGKYEHQNFFF